MLVEEAFQHADAKTFLQQVYVSDTSRENRFMPIFWLESKWLQAICDALRRGADGDALVHARIELPHCVALIVSTMPAAHLTESTQLFESLF
ncbi:hypothetical protein D9M68_873270 [compost metagenome]